MTDDDAPTGLRERKKRQTRLALAQAAVGLVVERGWDRVTEADVAAAADVSERTFRNHFAGKADAVAHVHLERFRRIAAELGARPVAEPLWEAVTAAVADGFAVTAPPGRAPAVDPARWLDGVRLMIAEPALATEMARVSARGQDELAAAVATRTGTDPATDPHPHLVAAAVGAAVAVAIRFWLADPGTRTLPALLDDALGRIAAGLPAPGTAAGA